MRILVLAFLSGIPALVYEVVWTREVALLVGSQVEAISAVLAAFFGGLALGAHWGGRAADRAASPLRLYGVLEVASGVLAVLSTALLRALGESALAARADLPLLFVGGTLILPTTFLLGATMPALLRASVRDLPAAPGHAGWIVGANTAGSVLGVGAAAFLIPTSGLRLTLLGAGAGAVAVGAAALVLGRAARRPPLAPRSEVLPRSHWVLAASAVAGVATLGYEVLAARMATLQLGSSLYAWAAVLAMLLTGLAAGNLCSASRAARTGSPERDLGWIEVAAAVALAAGLVAIAPSVAAPAAGLTTRALLAVAAGVLPPAFLMGAAFPFFVRLALSGPGPGAAFGAVSAANTAGGIAGALLAPFALLPALGPGGGTLACAGLDALLGLAFLARGTAGRRRRRELAIAAVTVMGVSIALPSDSQAPTRVIHVQHGRQATVAVVVQGDRRDLIVDGDPEASTAGAARDTEEFLAALPLLLHPAPENFLEIGLGSGITLGTASRFPLRRIECVEIAASVIAAARFFAPDNAHVGSGRDPRVRVVRGDGRAHLLRHAAEYDIVVANTLHPWSVGATGLYSRQYFARLAGALRPGGIAVQWLPVGHIGAENLAAILRTYYATFEAGALWWGAENLMLVGSDRPSLEVDPQRFQTLRPRVAGGLRRLGISGARELTARRLAGAEAVRAALGPGEVLSDDRPTLEARAARGRANAAPAGEFALLEEIAQAGNREDPELGAMWLWIQSRAAQARGEADRRDRLERLAEAAGLDLARRSRAQRILSEASKQLAADRLDEAERSFQSILAVVADDEAALLGLAVVALRQRRLDEARDRLGQLIALRPDHAEGWNLLGVVHRRRGEAAQAERAFANALRADPFFPEALTNAGLLAAKRGDDATAREMLARLRAMSRGQPWPEERALAEALARERNG